MTNQQDDQKKNIDLLIDITDENLKDLPFKQIEADDEKFNKLVLEKIKQLQSQSDEIKEKQANDLDKLKETNEQLQQKIKQLEQEKLALEDKVKALEEANKPIKEYDNEILESLIFPINTIDQIASAYRNTGENELVAEQLEKVAELTISQIGKAGIEEIPVYGKEIDGAYMESFGPANHVKDETLPPHAVAIVSRRAFKKKDSDEIIQHALVYTVPEEE